MKKLLVLSFLCFNVFLLQGCINYIQDVQLYADGSGSMRINYWMKLSDSTDIHVMSKIGIFNKDSIRSQFTSKYVNIKNINVYTDSTDKTTHAIIDLSFSHIDSLNNTRTFATSHFSLTSRSSGLKNFSQFIPPIATGFGINPNKFYVTYKYTFGGEITSDNATSREGRTLVWHYSLAEIGSGKNISVSFRPFRLKRTPEWIYILSGMVLLIVLIFLLRKKKN